MNIKREDFVAAADQGILQHDQVEPLVIFLQQHKKKQGIADTPRFSGTHVLYYLGGLLAISAASLFATLAVEAMGMTALLALTLLYAFCAIGAATWFEKHGLAVPASIFATLAIALVPLAVFALQHVLGFWDEGGNAQHYQDYHMWIDWRWIVMELSTLLAGVLMLIRFRYPFLVLPIALTLWYLGMDVVPAIFLRVGVDNTDWFSGTGFELRKTITLVFGLLMLLLAFFVDLRSRHGKDFAFWLYLFGLLTFWGALSSMGSGQLSGKLIYLLLNFFLVFIGAVLVRRTFAVFGGSGIMMVLGDLSWNLFQNSFAFVVVLTLLGFVLIGLGVWWSKHEAEISSNFRNILPKDLRELLERRAVS
jgi:hypothetical protein